MSKPVFPQEIFEIIAEYVLASKDVGALKAFSLLFRHWTRTFQSVLISRGNARFLQYSVNKWEKRQETREFKRPTALAEVLKGNPSFGEFIEGIEVEVWDAWDLLSAYQEDLPGLNGILPFCPNLQSFDFRLVPDYEHYGPPEPAPAWSSIAQPLRGSLERIGQTSSLKQFKICNANVDWSALIGPNSRLERLELDDVASLEHEDAWIGPDPVGENTLYDEADAGKCGIAVIEHLVADPRSAEGLSWSVHPTYPPKAVVDFRKLQVFETLVSESYIDSLQDVLEVTDGLKKLQLTGASDGLESLFHSAPHPRCFFTSLKHLVFDMVEDTQKGIPQLQHFADAFAVYPARNFLQTLQIKICDWEPFTMLDDWRGFLDVLEKTRFRALRTVKIIVLIFTASESVPKSSDPDVLRVQGIKKDLEAMTEYHFGFHMEVLYC